jgi:hypothetical protein
MLRKILIGTAVLTLGVLFINNGTVQKSIGIDKKETRGAVATNEEESALLDKTDTVKFKPLKLVSPNKKEVRKLTLNPNRTVHIVGPIGFNALGVAEKISLLASQSNSPIFVVLSSPGGSVMAGAAVIAAIQAAQVPGIYYLLRILRFNGIYDSSIRNSSVCYRSQHYYVSPS